MHPLGEDVLRDLARGIRSPEAEAHLAACPECAQALDEVRGLLEDFEALREAERPASEDRLPPRRRIWPWAAAAGLLLALAPLAFRNTEEPRTSDPAPAPPSTRLLSPAPGLDLLLSESARVEGKGADWKLSGGDCLVRCAGTPARFSAGPFALEARQAEFLVRLSEPPRSASWMLREACAAETLVRVVVLDGEVSVQSPGGRLLLKRGDSLESPWTRGTVPDVELARLRDSVLPPPALDGTPVLLEAGSGLASRVLPAPREPYQALLRFRGKGAKALGLSFSVGGESTLLPLPAGACADGARHEVRILVSANRIRVELDGKILQEAPRVGFRANPEAGLDGVGLAVWGGRAECEGPGVDAIP